MAPPLFLTTATTGQPPPSLKTIREKGYTTDREQAGVRITRHANDEPLLLSVYRTVLT